MNQIIVNNDTEEHFINLVNSTVYKNCLLVSSNGNFKRGYDSFFINQLLKKTKIYKFEVNNYPDIKTINSIFKDFAKKNIDLVISIGGGSAIDLGKIFASCCVDDNIEDFNDIKINESKIFNIAIPTTAGSGAESTKFATIWSKYENVKYSFENPRLLPEVVYLNEKFSITLPYDITVTTALDALCHCLDSLWNRNLTSFALENLNEGINLILKSLPSIKNDLENLDTRKNLLLASNKAGHAINTTRTSLNHAISYPLTNLYDLQHGLACAFSIPGIVSLFENDLKQIKEYELIKASLSLISKLELKEYYKPHLKNIDIELVSEQILINARSKNFIYDITKDNIKNILNTSKKFFALT